MPLWVWILVDLGILLVGGLWLAYLGWGLAGRASRISKVTKPMFDQIERIQAEVEQAGRR